MRQREMAMQACIRREQEEYTMKKPYALALFGLLFCNSLSLFAVYISTDTITQQTFLHTRPILLKVQAGDSYGAACAADVDRQLAGKRLTKAESNGNASITAFRSTQEQPTMETFYNGSAEVGMRGRGGLRRRHGHVYDHH